MKFDVFGFRKSVVDERDQFETEYAVACIIIFKYLETWFKQVFEGPDFRAKFGEGDIYVTLAAQVEKFLLGEDLDDIATQLDSLKRDQILQVKDHVPKWADDVMVRDVEFCEFVVQTLRLELSFHQIFDGPEWPFEDVRGRRVAEILMRYGDRVLRPIDPKKYTKLLRKWMAWDEWMQPKGANDNG